MIKPGKHAWYILVLVTIPLWTIIINIYHLGAFPIPSVDSSAKAEAHWYPRSEFGINNLVLVGPPFARGRAAGELTAPLLLEQEEVLVSKLETLLPAPKISIRLLVLAAISWFHDADRYFPKSAVEEMYGISLSAPRRFDYLADGFTRQVAYHGLHEVGQMMVDQGFDDSGCTVAAVRSGNSFVIGRNFDFEAGRIFDRDKIVKWTFPDEGYAFVSVIWAGMVGAVTGVNEKGLYISLNAAGSSDHRRIGVPSTLVLLDVLQHAATAEEAVVILRKAPMFITDIFAILDRQGHLYRIEKSPLKMNATKIETSVVIANHLNSVEFATDATNLFRKQELTTVARETRGLELIHRLPKFTDSRQAVDAVLSILRDKGVDSKQEPLAVGNRLGIDALIAMHSVIYDPDQGRLYVSQGPAVSGPFQGYNLSASFKTKTPVRDGQLPADPLVSEGLYQTVKLTFDQIGLARKLTREEHCDAALTELDKISAELRAHSEFYSAQGDAYRCLLQNEKANAAWTKALSLSPAYARQIRRLKGKLSL